MAYQIIGFLKHSEIDNYRTGCLLKGGQSYFIDYHLVADTLPELLQKCIKFTGGELCTDMVESNRLDFQRTENDDGVAPSKSEQEQWQEGEINLWLCNYSCLVEIVQEVQYADCSELFKGQNNND